MSPQIDNPYKSTVYYNKGVCSYIACMLRFYHIPCNLAIVYFSKNITNNYQYFDIQDAILLHSKAILLFQSCLEENFLFQLAITCDAKSILVSILARSFQFSFTVKMFLTLKQYKRNVCYYISSLWFRGKLLFFNFSFHFHKNFGKTEYITHFLYLRDRDIHHLEAIIGLAVVFDRLLLQIFDK